MNRLFRSLLLLGAASAIAATGACSATGNGNTATALGEPVESRPPNNPDQKPAFEGQTRAPGMQTTGQIGRAHV